MVNPKFSENIEAIKENIYNTEVNDLQINGLLWSFLTVSSSLTTFLPKLKSSDHYKIVQNMQFHRSISSIDLLYPSLLENTKFYDKSNIIEQSYIKGHIFVGYHAGAYNMMLRCLAEKNVPFCVVANNEYIKEYEQIVQKLYEDLPHEEDSKKLEIFSAEDPKLLLKLTKNLSIGISVFIFIDGNSGSHENSFGNDKNLLKIDFLNHHIYARQGVAYLSYLSKAPIVTVMARRDKKLNNIVKINLLKIDKSITTSINRNNYINSITQKIYKELELFLIKNYEQWSGWFYIHKFFDTDILSDKTNLPPKEIKPKTDKLIVNDFIHLIEHDENHLFLVMKKTYEIMRIEKFLFDVLSFFKSPQTVSTKNTFIINNEVIGFNFIEELIEMDFLKYTQ